MPWRIETRSADARSTTRSPDASTPRAASRSSSPVVTGIDVGAWGFIACRSIRRSAAPPPSRYPSIAAATSGDTGCAGAATTSTSIESGVSAPVESFWMSMDVTPYRSPMLSRKLR